MANRTWKVDDLTAQLDDLMATGFCDVGDRALLRAELIGEFEYLVRTIYSHMDSLEHRKFYSAMRCWQERDKRTPSDVETWGQWFERVYGENLEAYAVRAAKEGIRKKVMEHEIATRGYSALEKKEVA